MFIFREIWKHRKEISKSSDLKLDKIWSEFIFVHYIEQHSTAITFKGALKSSRIQKVCNWHFPFYKLIKRLLQYVHNVLPHRVSAETILFWILKSKGHSTYDQRSQCINVRKLFKGGNCSRAEAIWGNTVCTYF